MKGGGSFFKWFAVDACEKWVGLPRKNKKRGGRGGKSGLMKMGVGEIIKGKRMGWRKGVGAGAYLFYRTGNPRPEIVSIYDDISV